MEEAITPRLQFDDLMLRVRTAIARGQSIEPVISPPAAMLAPSIPVEKRSRVGRRELGLLIVSRRPRRQIQVIPKSKKQCTSPRQGGPRENENDVG